MKPKLALAFPLLLLAWASDPWLSAEEKMDWTVEKVGVSAAQANQGLFNSPICTFGKGIYIAFVRPAAEGKNVYETVVGKCMEKKWQFSVVEPRSLNDQWHAQPSLVLDHDGYIHVTYNMHSSPWQYSVSKEPEDISNWNFRGQKLNGLHDDPKAMEGIYGPGTADIPGHRITYQFMTTDRNGIPYICYREALKTKPGVDYFRMQWSLGIAKYDTKTKKWRRVGPGKGVFPFATEPGFRVQGGHIYFDAKNRMHVSWIYYAEYEKDGSGHKKPNYPSYAYSDDGGETFHKADGTPLRLPIHRAESDLIRDPMSLSRPGIKGYFEGYTIVCSMPDSTPYVYLAPKDPPQGSGRAIIKFDTEKKRWSEPMPMPFGATTFSIDGEGVISAVSSGVRVHRSYDGGQSWKTWDLGPPEPSFIWLDYSYTPKTNQLRFLAQRVSTGELVVYTVNFTKQ